MCLQNFQHSVQLDIHYNKEEPVLEAIWFDTAAVVTIAAATGCGFFHVWNHRYMFFVTLIVFVVCISKGFNYGWTSPMIQILEKDDSPVGKMGDDQINILQTIPQFAAMLGSILVAFTLVKFGTKTSGYVQAVVLVGGWSVVLVADKPMLLYIGRFLTGISQVDTVCAFYLSEVVHDCRRGTLISAAMFGISLGGLLGYFLGSFCSWLVFNAACIAPAAIFPFLLFPVPETPSHLARVGRIDSAARSYSWFFDVGLGPAQRKILEILATRQPKVTLSSLFTIKSNRNALFILTFILGFTPLCGTTVISAYNSKIFETARSTISPNQSALMMATISFSASLCGTFLIDRAGRRFLITSSLGLMSLSLSAVSAYFLLEDGSWADVPSKEPLLYVGLGAYFAAVTVGVWTVAATIGAELVPGGVKGVLWMVSGIVSMLVSAATFQVYEFITAHLPFGVYFIQAAGFSILAVVIAWVIVPETKGKSLAQITAELSGRPFQELESSNQQDTYGPIDDSFSVNCDQEPIFRG